MVGGRGDARASRHPGVVRQAEDSTGALVARFAEDAEMSLFGTLSLWQGVDVPGPSLSLATLDRIPFPRPDDPLLVGAARVPWCGHAVGKQVPWRSRRPTPRSCSRRAPVGYSSATDDRGVIAILDPRLATARYGGFLRASLRPYWSTTDPEVVLGALRRLREVS